MILWRNLCLFSTIFHWNSRLLIDLLTKLKVFFTLSCISFSDILTKSTFLLWSFDEIDIFLWNYELKFSIIYYNRLKSSKNCSLRVIFAASQFIGPNHSKYYFFIAIGRSGRAIPKVITVDIYFCSVLHKTRHISDGQSVAKQIAVLQTISIE